MTYNYTEGFYERLIVLLHPTLLHNDTLVTSSLIGPTLNHREHNELKRHNFTSDLVT